MYGHGMRQRFSFSLGRYTTVFQTEVYVIKTCAVGNIKRDYCKINSSLAWDCHHSLIILAERKNILCCGAGT
jgi:hypothetical protein